MLKFLYDYELHWPAWKFGVLKISMLAFGILLGVMFTEFFRPWQGVLWGVFGVSALITAVWGFQAMADASQKRKLT
jgi:hypothetical protein